MIPILTGEVIFKLISNYKIRQVPRLKKLQDVFEGKHKILDRTADTGKPNNKLVLDYPSYITNIMTGYFIGKPITYTGKDSEVFLAKLKEIFDSNNESKENVELAREISIKGESFELLYIDELKQICFAQVPPEQLVVHYEPNFKRNIDYAIRFYSETDILTDKDTLKIEVYDSTSIKYFTAISDTELKLDAQVIHYFGEVPIIHYLNNKEKLGDWEKVITLINDLEERLSDNANELEAFRNAYIVATGFGNEAPELFEKFKQVGAMMLPDKDDKIEFLTKNVNDDFSEHHIERMIDLIHKLAMVPDLSDKSFGGNMSDVATQFKLYCMEQIASIKEQNFKEGLTRRLKLISNMLNFQGLSAFDWRQIILTFVRNIPANLVELSEMASKLKGIVSDETLMAQLPFITDVQDEIKKIDGNAEKEIDRDLRRDPFNGMTKDMESDVVA